MELLCVDPITGLRHRVRFEIVTDGSMIASVVEHSEIVDDDRRAPLQPMTTNDQHEMLVDSVRLAASSAEQQRAARRDSDLATKHLTMNFSDHVPGGSTP